MTTNSKPHVQYFAGLDLGQPHEFTGLAVLERTVRRENQEGMWSKREYAIRHLERFPLGTPYPDICERLKELFSKAPLARSSLTVDQSAVGKPIIDMLRQTNISAELRPVIVSAGQSSTYSNGAWQVPKQELISTVQVLLQTRRLKVPTALTDVPTLIQELLNFKMKVSLASADTIAAWREGPNDDLVLAVAVAAWWAERNQPQVSFAPYILTPLARNR